MTFPDRTLTNTLETHFGYDSFRDNQADIIQNVLDGKDTMETAARRARLLAISGVGQVKLERYGEPFMGLIRGYVQHSMALNDANVQPDDRAS